MRRCWWVWSLVKFNVPLPEPTNPQHWLIDRLSSEELDELEAHLKEVRARLWDEQIERDAHDGKLDGLLAEVDAEIKEGLSRPL